MDARNCGLCAACGVGDYDRCLELEAQFNLRSHLARQKAWSEKTFGPNERTKGVLEHIRKELLEIEAKPDDISEWIDVVILAFDGAWRVGYSPDEIIEALVAKQTKNESRKWPDWRTAEKDKAIEHVRTELEAQLKDADDMLPTAYMCGASSVKMAQPAQSVPDAKALYENLCDFITVRFNPANELDMKSAASALMMIFSDAIAAPTPAAPKPEATNTELRLVSYAPDMSTCTLYVVDEQFLFDRHQPSANAAQDVLETIRHEFNSRGLLNTVADKDDLIMRVREILATAPKPAPKTENRKCVFCKWSGTSEYLTVTPEGEFLCPKCHDRTVQQPEQGVEK